MKYLVPKSLVEEIFEVLFIFIHLHSNSQGNYIYPEELNEVKTVPENSHKLGSPIIRSCKVPPKWTEKSTREKNRDAADYFVLI